MQLTMARAAALRPILAIVLIPLLIVALVATVLFVGSQRRPVPAPFGPARNGAIVYSEGGDLFIADELDGTARTLVAGLEQNFAPVFSNQGDRVAFLRDVDDGFQVLTVGADGSNLKVLSDFPGRPDRMAWSPDGTAILVNFTETDITGFRFAVVNADGSGSRELDLGYAADYGSWRPDGRQIVFRGQIGDGTSSAFIADADGTNARPLPIRSSGLVDFEGLGWSPDGKHLSFMSGGELGGVEGWQLNIADVNAEGSLTELHQLRLDTESDSEYLPRWSPDSSQLAFMRDKDLRRQVGLFNADGTGYRLIGPETIVPNFLDYAWSPDGTTMLITELPDSNALREAKRKMWSVDVATGAQTEVQTPVATWQRLAP